MSVNISKIRREQLLQKIEEIRLHLLKNAPNPQLEDYLLELASEIKNRKFGLVFEKHREKIDDLMLTHLPVLTEDKELTIDNGGQWNFLIEGDNLPALQLLTKTHKEKVSVILIDPPYNRGENDFLYDDNYIDKNDNFRHSKWLSFMEKRLLVSKELLEPSGVIFIHIDENEFAPLKLLCDEIFGETNFIGAFIWKSRSGKGGTNAKIANEHEYIYCYAKNINNVSIKPVIKIGNARKEQLRQWGQEVLREDRPYMFYPILYNKKKNLIKTIPQEELINIYDKSNNSFNDDYLMQLKKKYEEDGWVFILPIREEGYGRWRVGRETIIELIQNGMISIEKDKNEYKVYRLYPEGNITESAIGSLIEGKGTASNGTKELKEIFGEKVFDTTKPIETEKFLIDLILYNKPNSIVLDFFAGSGTSGIATMSLNKADNGNRRFILVTNNENNICRNVTYERLKRVIDKENYQASLKYYRVDFIDTEGKVYYEYANELLKHIRELVQLENGVDLNSNEEFAIVLTDEEMDEFVQNLPKRSKPCRKLYVGHDVLPDPERERELIRNGIEIVRIPDYYYSERRG